MLVYQRVLNFFEHLLGGFGLHMFRRFFLGISRYLYLFSADRLVFGGVYKNTLYQNHIFSPKNLSGVMDETHGAKPGDEVFFFSPFFYWEPLNKGGSGSYIPLQKDFIFRCYGSFREG